MTTENRGTWIDEQAAEYADLVGSFVDSIVDHETDEMVEYQLIWEGGDLGVALTTTNEETSTGVVVSRVTGKGFPFGIKNVGPGDILLSINLRDTTRLTLEKVVSYLQECDLPATLRFKKVSGEVDRLTAIRSVPRTSQFIITSPTGSKQPFDPFVAGRNTTSMKPQSKIPTKVAMNQQTKLATQQPMRYSTPAMKVADVPKTVIAPKQHMENAAQRQTVGAVHMNSSSSADKEMEHQSSIPEAATEYDLETEEFQVPISTPTRVKMTSKSASAKSYRLDSQMSSGSGNDVKIANEAEGIETLSNEMNELKVFNEPEYKQPDDDDDEFIPYPDRYDDSDEEAKHEGDDSDHSSDLHLPPQQMNDPSPQSQQRVSMEENYTHSTISVLPTSQQQNQKSSNYSAIPKESEKEFLAQSSYIHEVKESDNEEENSFTSSVFDNFDDTKVPIHQNPLNIAKGTAHHQQVDRSSQGAASVRDSMFRFSTDRPSMLEPMNGLHEQCLKGDLRSVLQHVRVHGAKQLSVTEPNHGQTCLHLAVKSGCVPLVKLILEQYQPLEELINAEDDKGNTVLHFAATKTPGMVHILLEFGATTNIKNSRKLTPLIISVITAKDDSVLIPRMLLKYGANPNDIHEMHTVIHTAINQKKFNIAGALVRAGAKLDVEDAEGRNVFEKVDRKTTKNLIKHIYFPPTHITEKERGSCMICTKKIKFGHRKVNCTHCGRFCCSDCASLSVEMYKFPMGFPGRIHRGAANREMKKVCKTCWNVFKERGDRPTKEESRFRQRVIGVEWDEVNPNKLQKPRAAGRRTGADVV